MDDRVLYRPQSLQDLLVLKDGIPGTVLYAGGTELLRRDGRPFPRVPASIAYIGKLPELRSIIRTERYLDIGACCTLAELEESKATPPFLAEAARSVANPGVRNLATVGGNLCAAGRRMDLWAPLSAADAKVELRRASGSRWVGVNRLAFGDGSLAVAPEEVLTRVRLPMEAWNLQLVRKIGERRYPGADSALFCCLGLLDRDAVQELRLAYSGRGLFRERSVENILVGRRLPLAQERADEAAAALKGFLAADHSLDAALRAQYLALFKWSLEGLL